MTTDPEIARLNDAVFQRVTGAPIDIPGIEKTPFTKAAVDAWSTANNAAGNEIVRAQAAINGAAALIQGMILLELGMQKLSERVDELEQQREPGGPSRTGKVW